MVTRDIVASNDPMAFKVLGAPELMGHVAVSNPHTKFSSFRVPDDIHVLAGPGKGVLQ
jgi:hypothetical protein